MLMRIVIPASGPSVNDMIDTRFQRAPFLISVILETGATSFIRNPFARVNGDVEPRLIQFLVKNQVTNLISPRIRNHTGSTLPAAGILVFLWEGSGSVSSALEWFNSGKLTLMAEKFHAS